MFGILRKKHSSTESPTQPEPVVEKKGLFGALTRGLKRTRVQFTEGLANLFLGKKTIDAELLEEIETQLLSADVGVEATQRIVKDMTAKIARKELQEVDALYTALQASLMEILAHCNQPWEPVAETKPYVILMVGVNGAGKTTTIGKLTHHLQKAGKSVMLAAGDTFRAAAIEQLQAWGERNHVPVIAQQSGADSASVAYDALAAARARNVDVLIVDTAGRLHTQSHLMEELKKIKRVLGKLDASVPHEAMLVLDAGIGQNALRQAEQFNAAVQLNSVVLTKLDGSAKGGMIFSVAETLKLPIRFVGVGEQLEDLQPFNASEFIQALFNKAP